ncbi:MAG: NAD(+)/NADH kinase [Actinomycetes bacterium]
MTAKTVSLLTHNDPRLTSDAVALLAAMATERGISVVADTDEHTRHRLDPAGLIAFEEGSDPDLRICLGGDGTVLRGLRRSAGTRVPVFGVNFGEVGFLAACDPVDGGAKEAFTLALDGAFDELELPALKLQLEGVPAAFNDVCVQRRPGLRIADVAYSIGGEEIGRVRCDGVVVATPAGSTGYNLANGGPVVAWGVEGFAVSFIAPHSLTARSLVVAPDDRVRLSNRSSGEPVDLLVDGRPAGELGPGADVEVSFVGCEAVLAQLPGSSFYQRLREKFGRLAT